MGSAAPVKAGAALHQRRASSHGLALVEARALKRTFMLALARARLASWHKRLRPDWVPGGI